MYDYSNLFVPNVVRQHHRSVLLRMITRELDALNPILLCEIRTQHRRWITATFYINQQHRIVCPIWKLTGIVVAHVNMGAMIEIAGATLPTRTPTAIRESYKLFPPRCHTSNRLGNEIRRQRRNRGIHIQWYQEQKGRTRRHRNHGQQAGRIE